jgi:uncharacterized Zn-finger protein
MRQDKITGRFVKQFQDKELVCEYCDKKFIREHHRLNRSKHNFCSLKCAYEFRKGKNSTLWMGGEIETTCDYCGKPIKIKKYQLKQKNHFCSYRCHGDFKKIHLKGISSFFKGHKHKEESKIKIGNKSKGKHHTIETKKKISKSHLGINSGSKCHFFGKPPKNGKWTKYKSIWMRSTWESAFAKWCDKNLIKWQYEPKTFDLGNITYTPDFYLPEFNLYIEIKGWWRDNAKIKFKLFKQKYCGERIKLLEKSELKTGGIL